MARILVIDDEELVRASMRMILEAAGHEVAEAENGEQGIDRHRERRFDIVITNILMPHKEGIETILELRRDFASLKIIAISGGGRTRNLDYLEQARKLGADVTLAKPFSNEQLLESVDACRSGPG